MDGESIVDVMRNHTEKTWPDYKEMNDQDKQKVYDFYCDNTIFTFERFFYNRLTFTKEKQYYNATCGYGSLYETEVVNLRFFFHLASGAN